MRVKLTDELIAFGLQCPPGRRKIEYVDISDAIGLYIEVRAAKQGEGVFRYRFKDRGGTTRHARIGKTTEVSLAEARAQAKDMRAKVALGIDPRDGNGSRLQSGTAPKVPTLGDYFDDSYYPYIEARNRGANRSHNLGPDVQCDEAVHRALYCAYGAHRRAAASPLGLPA